MADPAPYISSRFTVSQEARAKVKKLADESGIPMFRLVNENILGLTDKGVDAAIKAFKPVGEVATKIKAHQDEQLANLKSMVEKAKADGVKLPDTLKKDIKTLLE